MVEPVISLRKSEPRHAIYNKEFWAIIDVKLDEIFTLCVCVYFQRSFNGIFDYLNCNNGYICIYIYISDEKKKRIAKTQGEE